METYRIKLRILRGLFRAATWILSKASSEKKWQYKWLHHYVAGSGKDIVVPNDIVEEAGSVFLRAIENYHRWHGANGKPSIIGKYYVSHSTMYDGAGFDKRPKLFYMMGCFAFVVEGSFNHWTIKAADHYDWHPADKEGHYFSSPIGGENKFVTKLIGIADKFIGNELFCPQGGWPTYRGGAAISNKLWAEMEKVGAKPFDTTFSYSPKKGSELCEQLNSLNREKKGFFAERFIRNEFRYEYRAQRFVMEKIKVPANHNGRKQLRLIKNNRQKIIKACRNRN